MNGEERPDENARPVYYYWKQGFMRFSPSLVHDRDSSPYQRPSMGLFFSLSAPITIETGKHDRMETHAALIAPNVVRRRINCEGDIVVCDIPPVSPEFQALAPLLKGARVRELNVSVLISLADELAEARGGKLDAALVRKLLHRIIFNLTGRQPQPPKLNPHIMRVLQLIQEQPLGVVNPTWLAEQVNLSPSWLRNLFRKEIGSSLSQYLRWSAVWKAAWLWSPGEPWAECADTAGFHDFSHFNRAFNATFGTNPSTLSNPHRCLLIRCEWD